jgi:oxaloacetate decarboxylase (Na+ extruding) subunit gamma
MEAAGLISQGVELAVIGMGTVFIFLTVLILITRMMSSLVLKFEPAEDLVTASSASHSSPVTDQGRLLAIITAAISEHRNSKL